MFGSWGTTEFRDIKVQTPDGPGVIKGIRKNKIHVKLTKSRGRPRHYDKKDVQIIDTRNAEDIGAKLAEMISPVPVVGEQGAKWALKKVFARMFRYKTGY